MRRVSCESCLQMPEALGEKQASVRTPQSWHPHPLIIPQKVHARCGWCVSTFGKCVVVGVSLHLVSMLWLVCLYSWCKVYARWSLSPH